MRCAAPCCAAPPAAAAPDPACLASLLPCCPFPSSFPSPLLVTCHTHAPTHHTALLPTTRTALSGGRASRHAFGDQYRATDMVLDAPGKLTMTFTPADGSAPSTWDIYDFKGGWGGAQCRAVPCRAVPCRAVLCRAVLCCAP